MNDGRMGMADGRPMARIRPRCEKAVYRAKTIFFRRFLGIQIFKYSNLKLLVVLLEDSERHWQNLYFEEWHEWPFTSIGASNKFSS